MAEIVNLRRARKQRDRDRKEAEASANRVRFGRRKDETAVESARRALEDRRLEGHRRDDGGDGRE